ncbi:MAG: tail fiber domain-containing protein [Acidobacteriota bacterium]|nr:tail fiber domain-containing protein [Acidobacteriota bacterium]
MKNLKCLRALLWAVFVVVCFNVSVSGQSAKLASIASNGSSVRWDVSASNSGVTMTVSAPDGRVFRKEFKAGASPEFTLTDKQGERLPDGQYTYELRLSPAFAPGVKETLAKARGKDDDSEAERSTRKQALPAEPVVQSGSFSILNGAVIVAGAAQESGQRQSSKTTEQPRIPGVSHVSPVTKLGQHHPSLFPDQVIPDDVIVQGSACVGLDCVNNETFGFDTIRLKENNTRIQFNDTSTAAGFPTNNWQIRANDSASGGASFLGFMDQGATGTSETGTLVFSVAAGAPANSVKVDSGGRLGLRTATPVLDVHANTSNTPAIRLEQNSSGGFSAQTWDIGANEANFFVRDVTGGSRLPFRVRPGAPTSSIDISANGDVGIGTASPSGRLHVTSGSTAGTSMFLQNSDTGGKNWRILSTGTLNTGGAGIFGLVNATDDAANYKVMVTPAGNVGIGTAGPTALLSVNGTANKPGGGSWDVFSDERLKNIKGNFKSGLKAVMELQPLRYEYRRDNALGLKSEGEHVGFGAQALQKVIPEAVTRNANGYLQVNNDPILWTMLNAIKEQQNEITELKKQIRQLRTASRRHR